MKSNKKMDQSKGLIAGSLTLAMCLGMVPPVAFAQENTLTENELVHNVVVDENGNVFIDPMTEGDTLFVDTLSDVTTEVTTEVETTEAETEEVTEEAEVTEGVEDEEVLLDSAPTDGVLTTNSFTDYAKFRESYLSANSGLGTTENEGSIIHDALGSNYNGSGASSRGLLFETYKTEFKNTELQTTNTTITVDGKSVNVIDLTYYVTLGENESDPDTYGEVFFLSSNPEVMVIHENKYAELIGGGMTKLTVGYLGNETYAPTAADGDGTVYSKYAYVAEPGTDAWFPDYAAYNTFRDDYNTLNNTETENYYISKDGNAYDLSIQDYENWYSDYYDGETMTNIHGSGLDGHEVIAPTAPTKTINVRDYGAIPNDGINDYPAIIEALNAATYGTALVFESGTYTVETDNEFIFNMKDGVSFIGADMSYQVTDLSYYQVMGIHRDTYTDIKNSTDVEARQYVAEADIVKYKSGDVLPEGKSIGDDVQFYHSSDSVADGSQGTVFKLYRSVAARDLDETSFFRGVGVNNLVIKNITLTANYYGNFPENDYGPTTNDGYSVTSGNNLGTNMGFQMGNFVYGVWLDHDKDDVSTSKSVHFENLVIENFSKMAMRIAGVEDMKIANCLIHKAVDLGGGGCGYAISLQGSNTDGGGAGYDFTDHYGLDSDSRHNLIENNYVMGPSLRHGILFEYFTHNNTVRGNTLFGTNADAIDLHGEDELLFEVSYNTVYSIFNGYGIAIGNSGVGHDAGGPQNWVYRNDVIDCSQGIGAMLATEDFIIQDNRLYNIGATTTTNRTPLTTSSVARVVIKGNSVYGTTATTAVSVGVGTGTGYSTKFGGYLSDLGGLRNSEHIEITGNNFGDAYNVTASNSSDANVTTLQGSAYYHIYTNGLTSSTVRLYGDNTSTSGETVTASSDASFYSAQSTLAHLTGLQLTNTKAEFTKYFLPNVFEYYLYTNDGFTLGAYPYSGAYTSVEVSVDGEAQSTTTVTSFNDFKGESVSITPSGSDTVVTVVVTAEDGSSKQTYTIHVLPEPTEAISLAGASLVPTNATFPALSEKEVAYYNSLAPSDASYNNVLNASGKFNDDLFDGDKQVATSGAWFFGGEAFSFDNRYLFTEEQFEPEIQVVLDGKTLVEHRDYHIVYHGSVTLGVATIEVVGIGNYTGSVSDKYLIYSDYIADTTNVSQQLDDGTPFADNATWYNDQAALTLKLGESTLAPGGTTTAQVSGGSGDGKITYHSSNLDVATVDSNGKITAVGSGDVTITAYKAEQLRIYAFQDGNNTVTDYRDYRTHTKQEGYNAAESNEIVLTVTGSTGTETPEEDTTAPEGTSSFNDVNSSDWFYDAVNYAVAEGLIAGTGSDTFSPNVATTRGMFVTMLYSMEGKPEVSGSNDFTDVQSSDYFVNPVIWATAQGVTSGTGNNEFSPNSGLTREQLVVMLYAFYKAEGGAVYAEEIALDFTDKDSIQNWAEEAIAWATSNDLVGGYPDGSFGPADTATRAQVAVILQNFCNM